MNAKEAKKASSNTNQNNMQEIFSYIKSATLKGLYKTQVPYGVFSLVPNCTKTLQELGYDVKHGGNTLIISWE